MPATRSSLRADLERLGVARGDLVMVHAGVRALGPIVGGVNTIVQALQDAVGATGDLAAYVDFELTWAEGDPEVPVFDKRIAQAARDHGILHETLRTWPGALRSDHPDAGVVAIGPRAAWLTGEHPLQYGYGPGTPFAKIVASGGKVLLLGAPLDCITLVHHAEHLARIPDKRIYRYRRLMPTEAGPQWLDLEEFDTGDPVHAALPDNAIEVIVQAFLDAGHGARGRFGAGTAHLFDGAALVAFAVAWLERTLGTVA